MISAGNKKVFSVLTNFSKSKNILKIIRTCATVSSEKNIVRSACKDVEIQHLPLTNFIFDKNVKIYSNKVAMVDGISGRSLTYLQAYDETRAFGSALLKMGYIKGDVFAILMPNCPEYLLALLGANGIGCTVTTINPAYTVFEVARQLNMSKAKVILTQPKSLSTVEEAIAVTKKSIQIIVMDVGPDKSPVKSSNFSYSQMIKDSGSQYPDTIPDFDFFEDVATLPYSSGTTGLPKGVMLTHGNIVSNITQMVNSPELEYVPPTTETFQSTLICILPMYHIFGLNIVGLSTLYCGGKVITLPNFEPKSFIATLEEHKPNTLHFAPPLAAFCAHSPLVKVSHLESLIDIKVAAAPVGETLINQFWEKAPKVLFREGWGMTELAPVGTMTGMREIKKGSCGVVIPNTEAKIVDITTGETVGPGQTGELCIRGPQVMKGYLDNPEATKETVTSDGWLHSGDIALYDDDRFFYIVDRLKELIKVKGYQVPPAELEDLIRSIPGVDDIGVIGIPDEKSGEVPRAFIVKSADKDLSEQDVHNFVNSHVAKYKRLDGGIEFVDSIPKSAAGKILRRELKEMFEEKAKK